MDTGQHDQANVQLLQPPRQPGPEFGFAQRLCPGTGQDFGQVQIPLVVLHQHQPSGSPSSPWGCITNSAPSTGLTPLLRALLENFKAAKEIIQIGGQGGLPIGLGGF